MTAIRIPHDAYILVGDGRKALFLRNDGDEQFPNFKVERVLTEENPPAREQGSDRAGRAFQSGDARRSAMEQTDFHELEEARFARQVADAFAGLVRTKNTKAIVVVAPPKTLKELRNEFHAEVKDRIIAELDKDLTKHPVYEIERLLTAK